MAFIAANFACVWAGSSSNMFRYSTVDTHETIIGYNYFTTMYQNLRVGDLIMCVGPGGTSPLDLAVTTITGSAVSVQR
jgi:hypothetical protein